MHNRELVPLVVACMHNRVLAIEHGELVPLACITVS
jgi:hypothetical protein